jgi:hypothetical protein
MSSPITALELQEFRLNTADTAGEAARLVDSFSGGIEPAVPLLTSIDDHRDVAIVLALHAGETARSDQGRHGSLGPLVTTWQDVKRYGPRITERAAGAQGLPSYYRLAVTESGINEADPDELTLPQFVDDATAAPIGLLWIGAPIGTGAGLLVLVGNSDAETVDGRYAREWPLPLSRALGVRIYESRG